MTGIRLRRPRSTHGERGAVAVLVALLIPVLLGVSAIAIDGGQLYVGRRQAQNAADAAALALAKACAVSSTPCTASSGGDLNALAAANGGVGVTGILGTPCVQHENGNCNEADPASLPDCPVAMPTDANGVQVRASSRLSLFFAPLLGVDQSSPSACASAVWGPPKQLSVIIPFTFSACEWRNATGGDPSDPDSGTYPPAPPYTTYPAASFERVITLNDTSGTQCPTWNGHDVPGGFGWLDDGGAGTCRVSTSTGEWKQIKTGVSLPSGCAAALAAMITNARSREIFMPVYDCVADHNPGVPPTPSQDCSPDSATGTHVWYHVAGYAKFYVTGYQFTGAASPSIITGAYPCPSSVKCVSGFFIKGLVPETQLATDPNAPDFGTSTLDMVG